jgi:stage II sporulation protein AA (anti-sigma F factor antagonist)
MTISFESVGNVQVVALQGQINSTNAASIEAEILALITPEQKNLLLDFSALDYISSAGLRLVLVAAKRLKQDAGQLVLCGMQSHISEVFDISGFLAILNVTDTRSNALARF